MKTVAEIMIDQLAVKGVKRIYGVAGDAILGFMDALAKQDRIKFVAVKHESVAAMMASAEAKLTGNLAVCTATMGPGVANLINGLADAYLDKAPVLALTGQAPTNKIGTDYKQYLNQQELIKPIAHYSSLLTHPDATIDLLDKAMHLSESKGVVSHLSIPKDIFTMKSNVSPKSSPKIIKPKNSFTEEELNEVLGTMKMAKQPIILAGAGSTNAIKEVENLAEAWGAGLLVSLGAKTYPETLPSLIGGIGQGGNPYAKELFKQSDVILLVGDTWWPENYVPTNAKVIQIDLEKENIGKGVPTNIGILANCEDIVPMLAQSLTRWDVNETWLSTCQNTKVKWEHQNEMEGQTPGFPIHPSKVIRSVENVINSESIISIDTGDVTVWFNRNFRSSGQTMVFSGDWRTMGFGLPGAMAAKLSYPEKQVIALVGDGGLEMTLADLLTAVRYNLDITIIVVNNEGLQMERDKMIVNGYLEKGVNLTNPDFVQLAAACGMKGLKVNKEEEVEEVIQKALTISGPVLVDVPTAAVVHPETKKE